MMIEAKSAAQVGESQKWDADHAALVAATHEGVGLCTIVGIEGSFSRRIGAQLAVFPDGDTVGSLSDGCLEAQLAADLADLTAPTVIRYGHGSGKIDFRLPCGGGLDILLDPRPDRAALRNALSELADRRVSHFPLPHPSPRPYRTYNPPLSIRVFGRGPEVSALRDLAIASGYNVDAVPMEHLSLDQPAKIPPADAWTAIVLLFHDHEWEPALLEQALASDAFFIGAQGGDQARQRRAMALLARGVDENALRRVVSPIGILPNCKAPYPLALSILTQIVGAYERLIV